METFLYCGLSITHEEAKSLVPVNWNLCPPIKRGDLDKLTKEISFARAVIIDGLFHKNESIAIKEIRFALKLGWQIYGASSMGVLGLPFKTDHELFNVA